MMGMMKGVAAVGVSKAVKRRPRVGDNTDWLGPEAASGDGSGLSTRTIVIIVVASVAAAALLLFVGWVGYTKWASRKRKDNPGWTLFKRKGDGEPMLPESTRADEATVRPSLGSVASSKSRKQAAASREP